MTTIAEALDALSMRQKADILHALRTPDLYPAKSIADYLGVPKRAVHAWRKDLNLRKADS